MTMHDKDRKISRMSRQTFLKATALLPLATLRGEQTVAAPQRNANLPVAPRQFKIGDSHFHLSLAAGEGLKAELVHAPSNLTLAAGDYSYSFGQPLFTASSTHQEGNTTLVNITGETGNGLQIHQQFRISAGEPWLEEEITLSNRSHHSIALPDARCGFVLPIKVAGGQVESPLKDFKFTAVPFRREPTGNRTQYADYSLLQVLTEARRSELRAQNDIQQFGNVYLAHVYGRGLAQTIYPQYASEGWRLDSPRTEKRR